MEEPKVRDSRKDKIRPVSKGKKKVEVKGWEKPSLEDVSEKIMAQPYIRFT